MNPQLRIAGRGWTVVLRRVFLLAVIGGGAACTSLPPQVVSEPPEPVVVEPTVEPTPAPEPVVESAPVPEIETPVTEPAPRPRILVLRSSDAASYAEVAADLGRAFADRYSIEQVNFADLDADVLADLRDYDSTAIVAIGLDAGKFAAAELTLPTVVCQIYDLEPLLSKRDTIYGIAALPPLGLQLEAWKRLAPNVTSIGLFVTEREKDVVAVAKRAATEARLDLRVEYASSDRELLYRFKRLAPELDGLWLFPDNDILSPQVLRDVFNYAQVHRVHSIVFNPSLLSWGALLSVGGSPKDVAEKVATVVDSLTTGASGGLARVTPLSTVDSQVNEDIAIGFGLRAGANLPARSEVASK